tara:strand:+ start:255 stop:506 length:252 start_codon:yes stop_codon:yes gene_type:complete
MCEEFDFIECSIDNTYQVLVGEKTMLDIVNESNKDWQELGFFFDPDEGYDNEDLDYLISYYENIEAYERCYKLLKLKKYSEKD